MSVTHPKRVAIIGAGCSGISSFWALQDSPHDVHLFEASTLLGGRIKQLSLERDDSLADIDLPSSFNAEASPNFVSLLHTLGVSISPGAFGFGTCTKGDTIEWGVSSLKTVLRHPGILCNLETYRILFDIVRFKYLAVDLLPDKHPDGLYHVQPPPTVQEYLAREGFSSSFRDKYLTPLLSMLWGSNASRSLPYFPIATLCHLLHRHRLLASSHTGPKWTRIDSGANQIIQSMQHNFPAANVHLKTRVLAARPCGKGRYTLYTSDEKQWHFDHVIFAVDAQESIRILDSAIAPKELSILQDLRVSKHIAVLHSDPFLMPRKYHLRPSFNYIISKTENTNSPPKTCLLYNLDAYPNRIAITIDPFTPPHPRFVQHIWEYTDWELTRSTLKALHFLPSIQNRRGLSFCVSWTGSSFFEDAVTAGLTVAVDHLGAELPFALDYHLLDEVDFEPPRIGIRGHLVRTLVAFIRVCVLVFELVWAFLGIAFVWRLGTRRSRKDGLRMMAR